MQTKLKSSGARRRAAATPETAAALIRSRVGSHARLGLVLGSGFHALAGSVASRVTIPYEELPGFPKPGVAGHGGNLIAGTLSGVPVLVLSGRAHFYEGHEMESVTFAVRTLAALGVTDLLLTNAAGGIAPKMRPGDFMVLTDHINLMGVNPLRGPVPTGLSRFVDLVGAYDDELRRLMLQAAKRVKARVHRGVYLAVSGPSYETPAEIRAFQVMGADAVGMSTVPETIVARQCGMRVAGLSCITNMAAGRGAGGLSHEEVLAMAAQSGKRASDLIERFASDYGAVQKG